MSRVTNKKLDKKLGGLAKELNRMFAKELRPVKYKIKICNNQVCLNGQKRYIVGYLKCKRKDIPICGFRNFCPDAHLHYFDYIPEYVKKEG